MRRSADSRPYACGMTAVTVLAAATISQRKLERRLVRAGCAVAGSDQGLRVSRHGRWDAVTTTSPRIADLPGASVDAARRLLGFPPRSGLTCLFDGPVGESDSWPTVVDIARAVAAGVPLAVLDDHAGTTYLVHAVRGLIAPDEYEQIRGRASTSDFLRRLLGG
jgi:hypothetical protein